MFIKSQILINNNQQKQCKNCPLVMRGGRGGYYIQSSAKGKQDLYVSTNFKGLIYLTFSVLFCFWALF